MTDKRLSTAFRAMRESLGYPTAESGYRAQHSLSYDAYMNRESGRTEWTLQDVIQLSHDWGRSPSELLCLWVEAYEGSTFSALASRVGLSVEETRRRFERKRAEMGVSFEVLYLLVAREQTGL